MRSDVVSRYQLIDCGNLARLSPWNLRKIRVVIAGEILERSQQLLIERMPKAQFNGRRAIRPVIEVAKNWPAVAALRGRGQAKQIAWLHSGNEAVKALGGKAVALVDNHRMPMLR